MNTLPTAVDLETNYKKIDIKANPSQYNVGDILILRSVNQILPIKIMANPPAPYSVLNPDTSSLSPSEKSNGVRFVSASLEINHNINKYFT